MNRLYWDSCVVIYRLQGMEPWNQRIAAALRPVRAAQLAVTELTRMECRIRPMREGDRETLSVFDWFFAQPTIQYVPFSRSVFDLATDLRVKHRIKTPDALHLAAAISSRCAEFWTNDLRLEPAAAGRLKVVVFNDSP